MIETISDDWFSSNVADYSTSDNESSPVMVPMGELSRDELRFFLSPVR
jgi:hypothetical protein